MSRMNMAIDAFDDATDIRRTTQRQVPSALWNAVATPVASMKAAVAERRRINRAIAELDALSDHVLADIGVPRHDIERIVRYGRDASDVRS